MFFYQLINLFFGPDDRTARRSAFGKYGESFRQFLRPIGTSFWL